MCGEDGDAKATFAALSREFGWPAEHIVDLGGISAARGTELYVALWLNLWGTVGSGSSTSRSCADALNLLRPPAAARASR